MRTASSVRGVSIWATTSFTPIFWAASVVMAGVTGLGVRTTLLFPVIALAASEASLSSSTPTPSSEGTTVGVVWLTISMRASLPGLSIPRALARSASPSFLGSSSSASFPFLGENVAAAASCSGLIVVLAELRETLSGPETSGSATFL